MLEVAPWVALERGAEHVTVAAIIKGARVSRGTFYEQFADCEDCLAAAFEGGWTAAVEHALPAFETSASWQAGVRGGLFALLQFFQSRPELAQLCIVDTFAGGARAREARARAVSSLAAIVDRGREGSAYDPPPPTAHGIVGGTVWLLQARLRDRAERDPLTSMLGDLMSFIVLPYRGPMEAAAELSRKPPSASAPPPMVARPLEGLELRLTYRTMCVLEVLAGRPRASNVEIAGAAGISDPGQISKLLARLKTHGLVVNRGGGQELGTVNEWLLTARGQEVSAALARMGASAR